MRHETIAAAPLIENRARLRAHLPAGSLVVVNANDIPPANADGTKIPAPNSDLFYPNYPSVHAPRCRLTARAVRHESNPGVIGTMILAVGAGQPGL
jgi:hypothetical protein